MKQRMTISVCVFNDGKFDVIIKDPETGGEVVLSGDQKLNDYEFEIVDRLAPSCVLTTYEREE